MGAGIFRSAALRDPCAGSVKLDKSWAPYLKGLCLLVFQDVCGWKPAPWLLQFPSDKLTRHLINKQQIAAITLTFASYKFTTDCSKNSTFGFSVAYKFHTWLQFLP